MRHMKKLILFLVHSAFFLGSAFAQGQNGVYCELQPKMRFINVKAIGIGGSTLSEDKIEIPKLISSDNALLICEEQIRSYSYSSQTGTTAFKNILNLGSNAVLVFDRDRSKWLNPRDGSEVVDRSPVFFISPSWDDAFRHVAQRAAEKLIAKLNP